MGVPPRSSPRRTSRPSPGGSGRAAAEDFTAAAELRSTVATLQAILDVSPLAIIAVDLAGRIAFWSSGAELVYGWTAAEMLGRPPTVLAPPGEDQLVPTAEQILGGPTAAGTEVRRRSKSGEIVPVRATVRAFSDDHGLPLGLIAVHEDLRERKQLEAELVEAQKLQTVGRLAGGIAHNFNNILTAIIGYTDLALEGDPGPVIREHLEASKAAAERAGSLMRQLMAFSRRQILRLEPLDAAAVIFGLEPMLRQLVGETVELRVDVALDAGWLAADRVQLEQVILNLVVNAREAMPDGGRLTIRAEHRRLGERDLVSAGMKPGDYCVITVSDTGSGIDDDIRAHLFEPFFTTKEVGEGSGLGLSTSYGIVKQLGGEIELDSEPGRGTTFRLYFPCTAPQSVPDRPSSTPAGTGRGRVVVAEDDRSVRELAARALRAANYEVVTATDGLDALSIVQREGEPEVALLVTDHVMPRMRGTELARRLRSARPGLPVVFISGYNDDLGDEFADDAYLPKPFTAEQLVRTVADELGRAARKRLLSSAG